jgi:hypothetical protein
MFWAMANGYAPVLTWEASPVWFVALFLLIPMWESFYFYWIHRMLHLPWLYKHVHALHHRNINVGPWSGLSMHPVEHVIFLGSVLIHFIVPAQPGAYPLPHAIPDPDRGHDAYGFEGLVVQGQEPAEARHLSPPDASPLFRVQLRLARDAVGQALRLVPRWHSENVKCGRSEDEQSGKAEGSGGGEHRGSPIRPGRACPRPPISSKRPSPLATSAAPTGGRHRGSTPSAGSRRDRDVRRLRECCGRHCARGL